MRFASFFLFVLLVAPLSTVWAATEDFTITQTLFGDTTPPTTPTPVTATAVSDDQIDITWGAATDSAGIGGYVVYRDNSAIATTTLLSFSDSGLIASTTYTYFIQAFDNSSLYSSSSATSSATTEAAPVVAALPVVSETGSIMFPSLRTLTVSTTEQTARLEWSTNIAARYFLRWGRTDQVEIGGVQNELFRRNHETQLVNLQPGTTYYYELIAINRRGDERVLEKNVFTTTIPPDVSAPPNVALLTAESSGVAVDLSWLLPDVPDLEKIRIVRNHLFVPIDPNNGFVLYEGLSRTYVDRAAFVDYDRQFYTVYTYDDTGNISSGAVVVAYREYPTQFTSPQTIGSPAAAPQPDEAPGSASENETLPPPPIFTDVESADETTGDIAFTDVWFKQQNAFLSVINDAVELSADNPFTVGVPVSKLANRFRNLTIQFSDDSRSSAYLFSLSNDEQNYESVIETLAPGTYDTTLTLTALTGRNIRLATGTVTVTTEVGFIENRPVDTAILWRIVPIILLLLTFFLFFGWWRRRHRD